MYAGFANTTVNPPLGMPMEGLGQQGGIRSIHDDLFIRGLFLAQGEETLLILGCDLLFFTVAQVDRLKGAIGRAVDLPPKRILLNCSHTHAGPRLTPWAYGGEVDPLYFEEIEAAMVQVARAAMAAPQPVTVWAGMTETNVPRSRRKLVDGTAHWAPAEDAEVCTALPVVAFKDAAGRMLCLLFSVSCHPSTWYELEASADYPGVAMRLLNAYFGTGGSLFLQGCGGDTKAYTIAAEDHWRAGKWEDVEQAGREVAEAVITRVEAGLTEITPDLRVCLDAMAWPLQERPDRETLEAIRGTTELQEGKIRWAEEMLARLDHFGTLPDHVEIGIHGVQIGPGLRLVGLEGEAVGELGNLMLDYYRDGVTVPMGYTNACRIYLPTSHMIPEGGYEVDSYWEYHVPAPLAPGMEEIIREALGRLGTCGVK